MRRVDALLGTCALDTLRQRRSFKWRTYPADVLPAFVAEMDFDLAQPVIDAVTDGAGPGRLRVRAHRRARRGVRRVRRGPARLGGRPGPGVRHPGRDDRAGRGDPGAHPARRRGGDQPAGVPAVLVPVRVFRPADRRGAAGRGRGRPLRPRPGRAGPRAQPSRASRAYLLCSPHNPTGSVWTREQLHTVADLCQRHDVRAGGGRDPRAAGPAGRGRTCRSCPSTTR